MCIPTRKGDIKHEALYSKVNTLLYTFIKLLILLNGSPIKYLYCLVLIFLSIQIETVVVVVVVFKTGSCLHEIIMDVSESKKKILITRLISEVLSNRIYHIFYRKRDDY